MTPSPDTETVTVYMSVSGWERWDMDVPVGTRDHDIELLFASGTVPKFLRDSDQTDYALDEVVRPQGG